MFVVGDKVYAISNPKKVEKFIGDEVTITGTNAADAGLYTLRATNERLRAALKEYLDADDHLAKVMPERVAEGVIEAAIIEAGGRVQRKWFGREEKERYRGGPAEQELYDRITYDPILRIDYTEPEFWFGYADGYQRVFHSDGRTRSVGANDHYNSGGEDFSFAAWEGETLIVEARPRDGGFTLETYTLEENNTRLRVALEIRPENFGATIRLVRVYDRQQP